MPSRRHHPPPPPPSSGQESRSSTTVLIIELDQDLAELERAILSDEGYRVIASTCDSASLEMVQATNPDVIVLDLGPHAKACGWQLLSELHSAPDTQGIPLLVISDTEQLLERAKLSFNVRQEIFKPFDLSDLVQGVEAALAGSPLLPHPAQPPTTGNVSVEAAAAISRDSGKIMAEWLKRVQDEKVLGNPPNVPARVLMNNISVWLLGAVSALRYGSEVVGGRPELRQKIAEHIQEARRYGVNLGQIMKQFEILRDLLWTTLRGSNLENLTTDDVFSLAQTVNVALGEVMLEVAREFEPGVTRIPQSHG